MQARVDLDAWYVDHASLALDLRHAEAVGWLRRLIGTAHARRTQRPRETDASCILCATTH
jgi:hypothetical protein